MKITREQLPPLVCLIIIIGILGWVFSHFPN